ncbi:MAG: DUF1045 domain-containing protein [Proteobacteria bacterium]|nr:DUF1045 domain-containing protein [Pseudomonadota bacterium]
MKRYALYYAPPPGPWAETAARWLGRDAVSGEARMQPHLALAGLTDGARRYGFHATLKAPFRLSEGSSEEDLLAAVEVFAAGIAPFSVEGLRVAELDGFLALVPSGDASAFDAFAAQVVVRFDRFRAPLSAEDRARRRPERLSERQRALLDTYGYPWVMEEFRFHMTLTDRLTPTQSERLLPLAEAEFAPVLPQPFVLGGLSVFAEDAEGQFTEIHRARLG